MEQTLPFLGIISISFPFRQFPHHVEHHQGNRNIQKNTPLQFYAIKKTQNKQKTHLTNFWTKVVGFWVGWSAGFFVGVFLCSDILPS